MSELLDALRAQRIEFAGEVHDRIIPPLFAARMRLEALAARLSQRAGNESSEPGGDAAPAPATAAEIQQLNELVQMAISASRELLADLTPHEAGQAYWDSQIGRALGDHQLRLHQVGSLPWKRIEPDAAITLTAIAEEAVRNAVRHAEPSRIEIRIEPLPSSDADALGAADQDQETYRLMIRDDGQGFDTDRASDHHGLHLMRLRAAALGGQLAIGSQPGGPTEVSLQWPVRTALSR